MTSSALSMSHATLASAALIVAATTTAASSPALASGEQSDGGYIFDHNERTADQMSAARREVPEIEVPLPSERLSRLPKTRAILQKGGSLRIVMLGDSIINDTARSAWHELLMQRYPKVKVTRIVSVRGGTGCQWYREEDRIKRYVLDQKPDLVMIGGVSHYFDADAVRECVRQIRAATDADIMLMTGPYGIGADPLVAADWRDRLNDGADAKYALALKKVADDAGAEYLDMQAVWGEYMRKLGKPVETFKRDKTHANAVGEAVLARILDAYFKPASAESR